MLECVIVGHDRWASATERALHSRLSNRERKDAFSFQRDTCIPVGERRSRPAISSQGHSSATKDSAV
jgi:hypothetical protein